MTEHPADNRGEYPGEKPAEHPTADSDDAGPAVIPPPLPPTLLDPRPVIAVCTLAWVVAAIAAFAVPSLSSWRPVAVSGIGLAVLGTILFLWQRRAARSGARGAQTGLH